MAEEHGMSRMQELLSSYYGMQDKESEEESLRNIDSKGFDSKTYVKVPNVLEHHALAPFLSPPL